MERGVSVFYRRTFPIGRIGSIQDLFARISERMRVLSESQTAYEGCRTSRRWHGSDGERRERLARLLLT